eukprot:TRINITY_DN40831_c0_g1_i1.p2 TRINITY_DN40831_c0_g1~~TRINITY_DN40831_c0_g1_i1.p2  ORF type:complete len:445 (+),score=165.62 TRINITY_DN40831_c0_g1_i1:69-1403(+)
MTTPLSEEQRKLEEKELRSLASELKDLTALPAIEHHKESIESFAEEATSYADKIRDAENLEEVAKLVEEVGKKKSKWCDLMEMVALAAEMSDPQGEALKEAEARLRKAATDLKEVSTRGQSPAFQVIARVAAEAETSLQDFLACEQVEEKWNIFARFEENRARWLSTMEDLRSGQTRDGNASEAATDLPGQDDIFCDAVSEAGSDDFCKAADAFQGCMDMPFDFAGGAQFCSTIPSTGGAASSACLPIAAATGGYEATESAPSAPSAAKQVGENVAEAKAANMSQEEAREQIKKLLQDEEEGLLVTLRKTVAAVKEDSRFEAIHEDATKLLEQMELAAGAICPEALQRNFADDLTGAEEKLMATVEPMRAAQWGAFYSKKHASALQKYDLYKRRMKPPLLAKEHEELMECVKVVLQLAEYLRKEAQNALMDSVTGLVAQTMVRS